MYISAFHIDGFGILANTGCSNLTPGLSIFYGANEAGKSTCLEFLRVMLTGYPDRKQARSYEPRNGGHPGGSLILRCVEKPYEIRLSRSPASFGGLRLHGADGSSLPAEALTKLLAGVDREVYRRVFGFSLEELEQWDKKSDASIRNALYGASFGPGLLAPGLAMGKLEKRMTKIFRAHGTQQPLSAALDELEAVKSGLKKWQAESASYDTIAFELEQARQKLANIGLSRKTLEEERRNIERRLGQWQNWDQWRNLGAKIARLEPIPEGFPEDAVRRLATLQAASANAAANLSAAQTRLGQLEERAAIVNPEIVYVVELPELQRLAERKSAYRQACGRLGNLQAALKDAQEELAGDLAQLGPDWTCARIRGTDRSLFARDGMEKHAAVMSEARLACQTSSANLASANQDVESLRAAITEISEELEGLPDPVASLNEVERDELRSNMARLEESRRIEPARQRALDNARQAFNRALQQTQIFSGSAAEDQDELRAILDNLVSHQGEATELANEMRARLEEAVAAKGAITRLEEEAAEVKSRIEDLRAAQKAAGGPSREALEAKTSALRSLRTLAATMESEEERKKELEARINQEKVSPQIKNRALIVFALVFLGAAAAIFVAHWFFGIDELRITPEAVIPINLWAAYAALVCGVVLFAAGFSAHGPEQKRRKEEFARLLNRSETCAMRLAELATQSQQLCQVAGLENLDPIALDAMEMLLEREKEQLFHEERTQQEIEKLKMQLGRIQERIGGQMGEASQLDARVQHCRRRWHALMQSMNISNVPSPESMGAVFARVEAARLAEANVANAQTELDALWQDLHILEERITSMPAIKERLEAAVEPLSLEEAVKEALESCREAELIRDRRQRLQSDLDTARTDLDRASERMKQASARHGECTVKFEAASENWAACIEDLGLAADTDPETVREAYKYMQACLDAEDRARRIERELDSARAEIAAMEGPLQRLLSKFHQEPRLDAEGSPDWLATIDSLLAEAESNERRQQKLDSLKAAIAEQKDEVESMNAALAEAKSAERDLLMLGKASNADDFLRMARVRDDRRNLRDRQEDLEIVMEQACDNLQEFLASFSVEDKEKGEARLGQIQEQLAAIAEEDRAIAGDAAVLQERASMLAKAGEPGELRQKEEMLRESVKRMAREWSELALAEGLLKEAKSIFEKERQPEIIRAASDIFSEITDGRWGGMTLNLEDSSLMILPPHGEPVPPSNLSRGAQEQAYLALRLAYIVKHAQMAEPLPVIMDEVLVNFDPERARRTARTFARLAESGSQQIFYFTCQPHVVDLLTDSIGEASLYKVENGAIQAG